MHTGQHAERHQEGGICKSRSEASGSGPTLDWEEAGVFVQPSECQAERTNHSQVGATPLALAGHSRCPGCSFSHLFNKCPRSQHQSAGEPCRCWCVGLRKGNSLKAGDFRD